VDPAAPGQEQGCLATVAAEQAAPSSRTRPGDLEARQHLFVMDEPRLRAGRPVGP